MTSKDRVRAAILHKQADKVPAAIECVSVVKDKLIRHYNYENFEQVMQHFDIDLRPVEPNYIGPKLKIYEENSSVINETIWGSKKRIVWTGVEYNSMTVYFPFDEFETPEQVKNYNWPRADWFDYESLKRQLDQHRDKATIIGHPGPFQVACELRNMENLLIDMAMNPDMAHTIFDKMVEFELEYYEKMFIAGDGQIDILRPHDDYGTQRGLLFSVEMWREYFRENTKKLVNLSHKYRAFYQQHSCGAVRPIIPELIDCGIDILEPIQKVTGMEPEGLKRDFGDKLTFHGGIDTQGLLPFGTPEDVKKETEYFINVLGKGGGYILMSSQGLEGDVPIENIEAMYYTQR